jgi:hypothetical protein
MRKLFKNKEIIFIPENLESSEINEENHNKINRIIKKYFLIINLTFKKL